MTTIKLELVLEPFYMLLIFLCNTVTLKIVPCNTPLNWSKFANTGVDYGYNLGSSHSHKTEVL